MRIHLRIPKDADPLLRSRLTYAFRLFCAIYGHRPLVGHGLGEYADIAISYDRPSNAHKRVAQRNTVWLSCGYRVRNLHEPAPPPLRYTASGITTLLHHTPESGQAPDWLGEIFEWVSCADEYSVGSLDRVGRKLFAATYAGRHGIDTRIPFAAIAMHCLQQELCRVLPVAPAGPSPLSGAPQHMVVATHDIDYFSLGRPHAASRLLRNAIISCIVAKRPMLGMRQAAMALRVCLGGSTDPLDQIASLATQERQRGIGASYNFLVRHGHRRDAQYTLDHSGVEATMRWIESQEMEVGIHGSYTCIEDVGGVAQEAATLRARDFHPCGGRQHWLRYTLDRLIPAVERAGLGYDMSVGWADRIGFRSGACFAYPPYNFARESPASFLEIPMVIMDQALLTRREDWEQVAEQASGLLETSRRYGWGGISVLWHPAAFGGGWLPAEIGNAFWALADGRATRNEAWLAGKVFLETVRKRYADAGFDIVMPATDLPDEDSRVREDVLNQVFFDERQHSREKEECVRSDKQVVA